MNGRQRRSINLICLPESGRRRSHQRRRKNRTSDSDRSASPALPGTAARHSEIPPCTYVLTVIAEIEAVLQRRRTPRNDQGDHLTDELRCRVDNRRCNSRAGSKMRGLRKGASASRSAPSVRYASEQRTRVPPMPCAQPSSDHQERSCSPDQDISARRRWRRERWRSWSDETSGRVTATRLRRSTSQQPTAVGLPERM